MEKVSNNSNDTVVFAPGPPAPQSSADQSPPWKILVVDDEQVVHTVTSMVLKNLRIEGRSLFFLSAFSALEAKTLLQANPDIAVALIDVVMEHDHAGLELIQWIRDELKNASVRLILRTGQPGTAPEQEIIHKYEINDYKEKTELTSTRLVTTVTVAIRGYKDLVTIEKGRQGLEGIIQATREFWNATSIRDFSHRVLNEVPTIVGIDTGEQTVEGFLAQIVEDTPIVLAGNGAFNRYTGSSIEKIEDNEVRNLVYDAIIRRKLSTEDSSTATYLQGRKGQDGVLFCRFPHLPENRGLSLLELYSAQVALALDNLSLSKRMEHARQETIFLLGELVEKRSESTGNHVRRVGRIVAMLAELAGEKPARVEVYRFAASLHDIGKIAIPDNILNKPSSLSSDEFSLMQQHTVFGSDLLGHYNDELMRIASIVARSHHERWDGSGYPDGISKSDIPFPARLTSIADVFDALTHTRPYKEAWTITEAFDYILARSATEFDPDLVELFRTIRPALEQLHTELPD